MKTKTLILLAMATLLGACSKTEVVAPTPVPVTPNPVEIHTNTGETSPAIEMAPKDVHGADVSGKAQDMPEGTKEGEHTSNPIQAPAVGEVAPNPPSN